MLKADVRLFFGVMGSGKGFLALHQTRSFKRVMIDDPATVAENGVGATVCERPSELYEALLNKSFRICWRGALHMEPRVSVEIFSQAAWAAQGVCVMYDELDLTCGVRRDIPRFTRRNLHSSRHRDLHVFAVAQSAANLHKNYRRLATRICVFNTNEPDDLKYLRGRLRSDLVEQLPTLQEYHVLDFKQEGSTVRKSPFS